MSLNVPPAPSRSRQINEAKAKADRIRLDRAAVRREVRKMSTHDGMRAAADLIAKRQECVGSARVVVVMAWPAHAHAQVMERLCWECGISVFRLCRELTDRQGRELVRVVEDHIARQPKRRAS